MSINQGGAGGGFHPTSDRDALLAAILAQPDDDVARLVFADWLQENGQDARAQFIRAQVWAAQAEPFSREARKQAAAANRLLEVNRGDWSRPLQQRALAWEFRRGFVEHVAVNVATFPRDAAGLFAVEPIRSLQLVRFASSSPPVPLRPFFDTPQLERVTRLDVSGVQLLPVELEPLAECRYLGSLTDLSLRRAPVEPDWLAALISGVALPALAGLDLREVSWLGPRLANVFPFANHRRFLRLDLSHVAFTSYELKSVLESRCVRDTIEELRLGWMAGSAREGAVAHINPGWMLPWGRLRL